MDEFTNTPEEVDTEVVSSDDVSTDVSERSEVSGTETSPASDATSETTSKTSSQVRNNNAYRRMQNTNRNLRNKISDLEKRIQELSRSNKPEDVAKVDSLIENAETLNAIVSNNERQSWEEDAYKTFGDEYGSEFIRLCDKYGDHINRNEPQLADYIGTPYGQILLGEWMKRMEVPASAREWQQMVAHKKATVLARFYDEIETAINGTRKSTKQVNVPAPAGGKRTDSPVGDDNLRGQIDAAFKSYGY